MKSSNRFSIGSGVYRCCVCNHNTRDTGGDGSGVKLCDLCYDLAGEENYISDNGGSDPESRDGVIYLLKALDKRNGRSDSVKCFPSVCQSVSYAAG